MLYFLAAPFHRSSLSFSDPLKNSIFLLLAISTKISSSEFVVVQSTIVSIFFAYFALSITCSITRFPFILSRHFLGSREELVRTVIKQPNLFFIFYPYDSTTELRFLAKSLDPDLFLSNRMRPGLFLKLLIRTLSGILPNNSSHSLEKIFLSGDIL